MWKKSQSIISYTDTMDKIILYCAEPKCDRDDEDYDGTLCEHCENWYCDYHDNYNTKILGDASYCNKCAYLMKIEYTQRKKDETDDECEIGFCQNKCMLRHMNVDYPQPIKCELCDSLLCVDHGTKIKSLGYLCPLCYDTYSNCRFKDCQNRGSKTCFDCKYLYCEEHLKSTKCADCNRCSWFNKKLKGFERCTNPVNSDNGRECHSCDDWFCPEHELAITINPENSEQLCYRCQVE
jgi:hypothetical protein